MSKRAIIGGLVTAGLLFSTVPGISVTHVSAAKHYKIVLIAGIASDAFYITMNHGAQAEAKLEGATVQFSGSTAAFSPSTQLPYLAAAVAQHPDLILIAPTDSVAMASPIARAVKAGIPVILVDTTLKNPSLAVTTISTDNIAGGKAAADALARAIGGKGGKVAGISVTPGISTTDQRLAGFNAELKKFPKLINIGTTYATDSSTKAATILKSLVAAHKDLAGVFAMNVVTGDGVSAAAKEENVSGLKIVEFDAGPSQVAALKAGTVQALIAQYPYGIGKAGVQLGIQYLNGNHKLKRHYGTSSVIITPANVNSSAVANFLYSK